MLARKVSIHDVKDAEAFVIAAIKRTKLPLYQDEWEDMVAEGLCILLYLSDRYVPQMDGYAKQGSFAGYANKYLPSKIREAYHRGKEHHQQRVMDNGRREIVQYPRAVSWDDLTSRNFENGGTFDERSIRRPGDFVAATTPSPHHPAGVRREPQATAERTDRA